METVKIQIHNQVVSWATREHYDEVNNQYHIDTVGNLQHEVPKSALACVTQARPIFEANNYRFLPESLENQQTLASLNPRFYDSTIFLPATHGYCFSCDKGLRMSVGEETGWYWLFDPNQAEPTFNKLVHVNPAGQDQRYAEWPFFQFAFLVVCSGTAYTGEIDQPMRSLGMQEKSGDVWVTKPGRGIYGWAAELNHCLVKPIGSRIEDYVAKALGHLVAGMTLKETKDRMFDDGWFASTGTALPPRNLGTQMEPNLRGDPETKLRGLYGAGGLTWIQVTES